MRADHLLALPAKKIAAAKRMHLQVVGWMQALHSLDISPALGTGSSHDSIGL